MKEHEEPHDKSDEDLMQEYLQGDSRAFDCLYDRNADKIYGYLRRRLGNSPLVDDILQNTFLKFHQTREQYRSPLPVLPWLFTITRSVMMDALRAEKRGMVNLDSVPEGALPNESVDVSLSTSGQGVIFDGVRGLATLSDSQKQAIEFRFQDDLSFEQIAERLQTSPANVRQLVSRGLRRLKSFASGRRSG